MAVKVIGESWPCPVGGRKAEIFTVKLKNVTTRSPTEAGSGLDQRIKHAFEIECRTTDDLQHIGSGGLLLERVAQFVEQPRILDGDDGLGCKVLHQLNLLVGEWANFLAIDRDCPNQFTLFEHRHSKHRANAGDFHCSQKYWVA